MLARSALLDHTTSLQGLSLDLISRDSKDFAGGMSDGQAGRTVAVTPLPIEKATMDERSNPALQRDYLVRSTKHRPHGRNSLANTKRQEQWTEVLRCSSLYVVTSGVMW